MPQNTQQLPSELNRDIEMIEEIKHVPKNISDITPTLQNKNSESHKTEILPGTSSSRTSAMSLPGSSRLKDQSRRLTFHIHYQTKTIEIEIPDTSTVGKFQTQIWRFSVKQINDKFDSKKIYRRS